MAFSDADRANDNGGAGFTVAATVIVGSPSRQAPRFVAPTSRELGLASAVHAETAATGRWPNSPGGRSPNSPGNTEHRKRLVGQHAKLNQILKKVSASVGRRGIRRPLGSAEIHAGAGGNAADPVVHDDDCRTKRPVLANPARLKGLATRGSMHERPARRRQGPPGRRRRPDRHLGGVPRRSGPLV